MYYSKNYFLQINILEQIGNNGNYEWQFTPENNLNLQSNDDDDEYEDNKCVAAIGKMDALK